MSLDSHVDCVHKYIRLHSRMHVAISTYTCRHAHAHPCKHTHACQCTYSYMCSYLVFSHACTHVRMRTCKLMRAHKDTYMRARSRVYTDTHTYTPLLHRHVHAGVKLNILHVSHGKHHSHIRQRAQACQTRGCTHVLSHAVKTEVRIHQHSPQ